MHSWTTTGSEKKSKGNLETILKQMKIKHNILKLTECDKSSTRRVNFKIGEIRGFFLEKIDKLELDQEQREKTQINKIRNEGGDITTDP